jgi:hypothetical protein
MMMGVETPPVNGSGSTGVSVVLSFPETKLRAELELDKVELDVQIDEALFRVARERAP